MADRKILVKFNCLTNPFQVKCVTLPKCNRPDFLVLRELLFKTMVCDQSIHALGGSRESKLEDVLILRFDDDFKQLVDVGSDVTFVNKQQDLVVKLRPTSGNEKSRDTDGIDFPSCAADPYVEKLNHSVVDKPDGSAKVPSSQANSFQMIDNENCGDGGIDFPSCAADPYVEKLNHCVVDKPDGSAKVPSSQANSFQMIDNNENCGDAGIDFSSCAADPYVIDLPTCAAHEVLGQVNRHLCNNEDKGSDFLSSFLIGGVEHGVLVSRASISSNMHK